MAPRQVIADSDDEDGGDAPLSPPRKEIEPPEVEPLSPGALDQHNQISDVTDQSFFASVYDEQQSRAIEHSQLIENIVRQSQKASRSSGDVSLPTKGKGKKANASSATNVTSPIVLNKPGNQPSLFSDDATSITTPRKSAPGEWDVPSSAEAVPAPRTAKGSRGNEKSYDKRKRSQSKTIGSSAAAEMFIGDDAQDSATNVETLPASNGVELSPQPATKRMKASLHDPGLQHTPATANFYIAQSNLTTMQKLQYQKVNVPQYGYSTLPGTLPNPRSSGMTTIAYSTPSRYTSSGPPLPWERSSAVGIDPGDSPNVIDITSSPDVIAADYDHAEKLTADTPPTHAHPVHREVDGPSEDPTMESPPSKKRKRRSKSIQDEDELVPDESWNPVTIGSPQDNHKRQHDNLQKSNSPSLHERDEDIELVPNPHEASPPGEPEHGELPREEAHGDDELALAMPSTEPPISISEPEPKAPETQPAPQPKKRGRKKKQPATEKVIQNNSPDENQTTIQEQIPAADGPEVQVEPEKPKKKRGRPRKSDSAMSETPVAPTSESTSLPKSHGDEDELTSVQNEATEKPKPKPKLKKKQAQKQEENGAANDTTECEVGDRDASPLKEISSNPGTPSRGSMSVEGVSVVSVAESSADQNLPPKNQDKGSTMPKSTPTSSQPKVPYRVGLSKRTRIASLLKSIKR
ncbi:hypothetical protein F5Y06DRAFT_5590 [Hypoxylon sp. FL0890]|nr:hypothetical protein F5Y06DRAFT_5590 [Hypoxylon sp. FL0890]